MNKIKILIPVIVCMLLVGCAYNSGVIQKEQGTFMITRQASTGFEGSGRIRNLALYDARQFCATQGKGMHVVSIGGHHPPYIFGNFPRVELEFMCLDTNDPQLTTDEYKTIQHSTPSVNKAVDINDTLEVKLKTLNKLLSDGLITKDEFNEQKNKLLNEFTSEKN